MPEVKFHLKGWHAAVALVLVIALCVARFMTFKDMKDETALVKNLELQLQTEYFPSDVDKLKALVEAGDKQGISKQVQSITTTKLNIESVEASSPLLTFSTSKDVVIKVDYSVTDASGTRQQGTKYYLYSHGTIGNTWSYRYETGSIAYSLNFF